jgi:hypothetical protein
MNLYNVYFTSKGTGPQTVQIEALNQSGAKAQVEARVPWRLQHYFQPAPILCEEEIRLVIHAIMLEPSLVPGVPGFFPSGLRRGRL